MPLVGALRGGGAASRAARAALAAYNAPFEAAGPRALWPARFRDKYQPAFDPAARSLGHAIVFDKTGSTDEYVASVRGGGEEALLGAQEALHGAGYRHNGAAGLKTWDTGGGASREVASMALFPDGTADMHHAWALPAAEEGVSHHWFHHTEWSYYDDPHKHLDAAEHQRAGDTDGTLAAALGRVDTERLGAPEPAPGGLDAL